MKSFSMFTALLVTLLLSIFPAALSAQNVDAPAEEVDPNLTIHVVQRGENLFRIALRYGLTTNELAEINGIIDVSNIKVGQRLLVPAAETTTALPKSHIVQPGESLSSIAAAYNLDVVTLLERNDLTNPDAIYTGQELTIIPNPNSDSTSSSADSIANAAGDLIPTPAAESNIGETASPTVAENTAVDDDTPLISGNTHIVQPGETLFRIANSYGLSTNALASANNIADPTRIYSGQRLIIPGVEPIEEALDLPEPVIMLDVQPLIFKEGETGSISLETDKSVEVTATFQDRTLNIISLDDDTRHQMIVPIPLFTEGGIYPVELTFTGDDETQTNFTFNIRVAAGGYPAQNLNVTDENLLSPAVQDNELALITRLTDQFNPAKAYDGPLSIPAAAAMNAPFGTRRSYNNGPLNNFHSGADFATPPGAPIFAAADGTIVLSDTLNIRGNTIIIDHGWGVYTLYAHLTQRNVNIGEMVQTGQTIGTAGSTGRVTGPHLHWEVWVNGIPVNPLQWVQRSFP